MQGSLFGKGAVTEPTLASSKGGGTQNNTAQPQHSQAYRQTAWAAEQCALTGPKPHREGSDKRTEREGRVVSSRQNVAYKGQHAVVPAGLPDTAPEQTDPTGWCNPAADWKD